MKGNSLLVGLVICLFIATASAPLAVAAIPQPEAAGQPQVLPDGSIVGASVASERGVTDTVAQIMERQQAAPHAPEATPPDPPGDFPWTAANSGTDWYTASTLAHVENAFNAARVHENNDSVSAAYEPMPMMNLTGAFTPAQWNALTPSEQGLWLLNNERAARGLPQFEGIQGDLVTLAQGWADYLWVNDLFAHGDLSGRIQGNTNLANCWEGYGENLAKQSLSTPPLNFPIAKAIYDWNYNDSSSSWGHRHNDLYDPYTDNTGTPGQEGVIGFGLAYGQRTSWYVYIESVDFFDPKSSCASLAPATPSAVQADYGDLASSYGIAWNTLGGPYLGVGKSLESAPPTAETLNDGIAVAGLPWVAGGSGAVDASVSACSATCYLSAWIDWNADSDFADGGEAVLTNQSVTDGNNPNIVFAIPSPAACIASTCKARFRLSNAQQAPALIDAGYRPEAPLPAGGDAGGETEDYSWNGGILAVTLADFYAVQQGDAVLVTWETVSELNNAGFNVSRGTSPAGWDRQLNTMLIPSQSPGNPGGFIYTWDDRAELVPGTTYYYWLQDVDMNGAATMHGPVSVDFTTPTAVTLSGIDASPAGVGLPAAGALLALLAPLAGALAVRRRR